ncbi:MAG TPA: NUDIX hydrolase [Acidimicrobiales bacterium]|nr:NUDIX hydrolase [Acidimicrobiales bacterium]
MAFLDLGRLRRLIGLGRPTGTPTAKPTAKPTKTGTVRAGGGVVWRRRSDGRPEVILVHRPKYDDWSLPKGKLHAGEDEATAALREVQEETGLRCVPGQELPVSRYHDRFGRPKTVRYWAMTPAPGSSAPFVPNNEVDEVRWLTPDDAAALLSYERDREILRALRVETTGDPRSGADDPGAGPPTPSGC